MTGAERIRNLSQLVLEGGAALHTGVAGRRVILHLYDVIARETTSETAGPHEWYRFLRRLSCANRTSCCRASPSPAQTG